jgi:hypothetical protein
MWVPSTTAGSIAFSHVEAAAAVGSLKIEADTPSGHTAPERWSDDLKGGASAPSFVASEVLVPAPGPWKQWKLALLTPVSGLTKDPCGADAGQLPCA